MQSRESIIRGQVGKAAGAFLQACALGECAPRVAPLWIEIAFEGAWPFYVDAASLLRGLAGASALVCHTSYRPTPNLSAAPAIVFRALNAVSGSTIRHFVFVDEESAGSARMEETAARGLALGPAPRLQGV